ncbi:hypothetical protein D3C80_1552310 [compost metagenome]
MIKPSWVAFGDIDHLHQRVVGPFKLVVRVATVIPSHKPEVHRVTEARQYADDRKVVTRTHIQCFDGHRTAPVERAMSGPAQIQLTQIGHQATQQWRGITRLTAVPVDACEHDTEIGMVNLLA